MSMSKPNNPRRILVVDDDRVIALTLGTILRREGFDVSFFTDPHEALEAARSTTPDLLITDVVMPQMSGIELAIKLRESCPRCRVLLFSGQPATTQLLEDTKAKGHDFEVLAKPAPPEALLAVIRKI
jgi:CheY-like chemotaxis protein